MYKVRLVVDGQSFVSSDFKNAKDAEEEAFRKAYESLSKNTGTATSSSFHFDQAQILPLANNNSKNVLISEIKEVSSRPVEHAI